MFYCFFNYSRFLAFFIVVFLYSPIYMTVTLRTLDNVLRTFYAIGVMHRYCYSGYTQLLPYASNVQFLALSPVTFSFFVCASNISGIAERICAKFTGKTCSVHRSKKFECQGQRSKVKVTRDKNGFRRSHYPRQRQNGAICCTTR